MAALFSILYKEEILSQILSWNTRNVDFTRVMGCFCVGSSPIFRIKFKERETLKIQDFSLFLFSTKALKLRDLARLGNSIE